MLPATPPFSIRLLGPLNLPNLTAEFIARKIPLLHQLGLQGPKTEIKSPAARPATEGT